ncbi:MAG: hypothetical protein ACJAR1_000519 [Rubritalea sp.]|jgi:hypothetical protein
MNTPLFFKSTLALTVAFTGIINLSNAEELTDSYYKNQKLFSTRPSEKKSLNVITRFGPVGMGLDLIKPTFTIQIRNIEEGSPAALTGKLKKGQIIESINGEKLADIDPRMQLAQIIGKAEASDGILKFDIKGENEPVIVKLPVLGTYSKTWPLDCPKSEKIIYHFAEYLSKPDADMGQFGMGALFLLSTGDDKYLPAVKKWAYSVGDSGYAWALGYGGPTLCEYYLRTGDQEILPKIQKWVDLAVEGQYLDGWAGRGGVPSVTYGKGHLNAASTGVVTFLLLAKECGVDVPENSLQGALRHHFRYAGRGGNPYGDDRPEVGFVDNGKNGILAFTMAAAAALDPEGEKSIYAAARDVCAMQSFYTTSFMLHGHTGGGIGELWRSPAMGLIKDKYPNQYRDFMDSRKWHYELSRRWDGSFGILGGAGYDKINWGTGYGLAYTVPRKTLRLTGAKPTKFSKQFKLPKSPWGREADDAFVTLDAVPFEEGKQQDLSNETLAKDSSMQFIRWFHSAKKQPSDAEIWKYLHHRSHNIRYIAASKILGINSGYIGWRAAGGELRPELFAKALRSDSPRVRRAMFAALSETLRKENPEGLLTKEVFDLMIESLKNSEESWYVKDAALSVIGLAEADWVAPHADMLISFLKHEEAWLRSGALYALTPIVADPRTYKKVIPAVGELIRTNQRSSVTLGMQAPLITKINAAEPEVQKLAKSVLTETFTDYAGKKSAPGGQDISSTLDAHLEYIAGSLADVPGGLDVLYIIARDRYPDEILPYKEFFLNAAPEQFGPELKKAITPIIKNELIPAYVGKNRRKLTPLAANEVQSNYPGGKQDAIDGLTGLYDRAGEAGYNWKMFANIRTAEWFYHSFDPIQSEQVPFDNLVTRYREVTLPKGMEKWSDPSYDPAASGWETGKAPFGNYLGKLPQGKVSKCLKSYVQSCSGPYCFGALPDNTLWEKEVLLLRGNFEIPALKAGHRYRIRVNGGDHVGTGGGYGIWINGKLLIENDQGTGRGGGERPKGAFITKEFLDEFKGGKVTIAVKSFLRYNDKYKTKPAKKEPQGRISLHIEEQKIPPMGDDLIRKSATVVPMMSSEWQAEYDKENAESGPDDNKFRWDGKFVANEKIQGKWKIIAEVKDIDDFGPEKKNPKARRPAFTEIELKADGASSMPTWIWSGDHLMDLDQYQALRMQAKKIGDDEFLFIESGGFSTRQKPDWKSLWLVLKK